MQAGGLWDLSGLAGLKYYIPGNPAYNAAREQYAYSSHSSEGAMSPGVIFVVEAEEPRNNQTVEDLARVDDQVKRVIAFAAKQKCAIAVRTGGHQYSGASSTSGRNVQLDLGRAYTGFEVVEDGRDTFVTTGIGRKLKHLNQMLGENGVFVPAGQCAHVHIGGHMHTGGYGLPGRAFGLFGDHIMAVRVFTADGNIRWIERHTTNADDAELFWAILGGSPGNFAIATHIKLKVHRDADHPKARGYRMFTRYTKETLTELLTIKARMASDVGLPADFDMCVTVMSGGFPVYEREPLPGTIRSVPAGDLTKGAKVPIHDDASPLIKYGVPTDAIKDFWEQQAAPRSADMQKIDLGVAVIIVWAEWANVGGPDQEVPDVDGFFQRIRDTAHAFLTHIEDYRDKPMSFLTSQWVYPIKREFNLPYNKRTYTTPATDLDARGWVAFTADSIDRLVDNWFHGVRIVVQIQHYGGTNSRFRSNNWLNDPEHETTSYSWRDTTMVQTMDCFYHSRDPSCLGNWFSCWGSESAKSIADQWVKDNDVGFKGPNGALGNVDRRLLWASYAATPAEKDLSRYHGLYHEKEVVVNGVAVNKWDRLTAIKRRVDPNNLFTPNEFSVRA